jgi:oxygen-independent coproporphyrinogen-3 oxidase
MFGLPQQTQAQARQDVKTAVDLQPAHISYYQLTIEPNTLFHHQPPVLPRDDTIWEMQQQGQDLLAQHGYAQYETSAYAKQGCRCAHNLNYWEFGDYLGIGAGAHGKISTVQSISRTVKVKQPKEYLAKAGADGCVLANNSLSRRDIGIEFMMNALRLTDGFPTRLFSEHTGLAINEVEKPLHKAEEMGFVHWDLHNICPTERGRRYLNDLLELFLD